MTTPQTILDWPPPLMRLRCADCGYGASVKHTPERCPMCGTNAWVVISIGNRLSGAAGVVDAPADRPTAA